MRLDMMETVPMVMHVLRTEVRCQGTPLRSVAQLRALAFLDRNPGSCLFSVAEFLGVARPTASTIVDRWMRRGFVARNKDPRERRRIILTLTPPGIGLLQRTCTRRRVWLAGELAELSEAGLRKIADGLVLLVEVLKDAGSRNGK
jgi:DNA-binding MarR family transcriptional regulator